MKKSKKNSLARIMRYSGRHKFLTILGCILSVLAAVLGLIPYVCVWLVARDVLEVFPNVADAEGMTKWGWLCGLRLPISRFILSH